MGIDINETWNAGMKDETRFKSSYDCHKIALKSTSVDCSKIRSDGYK